MVWCRNRYVRRPPTGSVLSKAIQLIKFAMHGHWTLNLKKFVDTWRSDAFWNKAKPSNVATKPSWMAFDNAWVDEVWQGLSMCAVFVFLQIYWLSYGQMTNNLIT